MPLPVEKSVKMMREFIELSGFVVSELSFSKHAHILWYRGRFNQCLFFRQRPFDNGEMCGICMGG
jgi:hypothetical protein